MHNHSIWCVLWHSVFMYRCTKRFSHTLCFSIHSINDDDERKSEKMNMEETNVKLMRFRNKNDPIIQKRKPIRAHFTTKPITYIILKWKISKLKRLGTPTINLLVVARAIYEKHQSNSHNLLPFFLPPFIYRHSYTMQKCVALTPKWFMIAHTRWRLVLYILDYSIHTLCSQKITLQLLINVCFTFEQIKNMIWIVNFDNDKRNFRFFFVRYAYCWTWCFPCRSFSSI